MMSSNGQTKKTLWGNHGKSQGCGSCGVAKQMENIALLIGSHAKVGSYQAPRKKTTRLKTQVSTAVLSWNLMEMKPLKRIDPKKNNVSRLSDFTTLTSPELIEVHLPRSTKRHPPEPRAVGPRPPAAAPPAAPPKPSATRAGAPGTVAVSTILFDVCPIKNHKTHQNHLKP